MMSYGEILPIWWSMVWRGFLAGAVIGFVIGFGVGFLAALLGNPDAAGPWGAIAGTLVSIPVSLWAMRAAINKHHLRPAPDIS